ncbi:unnamed protein product [Adineta ricciae]|uniref:MARVEL domain-containing protein n=1 Tax=Adineta ricciae TaxID=249248 RepID=A0A814LKT7_ADIRI|nr:unnamed protein product [Adineta ricciae]CAF1603214.1 unnamed protein product [Adineta ricciae]
MSSEARPLRITCQINYLRTLPGILKIIQFACDILSIILGAAAPTLTYTGHKGFFVFVAILATVGTAFLLVLSLINLQAVCIPERWPMIEMFWCGFIALLYFIASIVIATIASNSGVFGAAAFFGFAAFIAYLADGLNRFRLMRTGLRGQHTETTTTTTTVTRQEPTY